MTRMIDADALTDRIEADKKQDNISPGNFFLFKAYIMNAPTIEPSGDLISRQSALAEFRDGRDVYDIMESIEELPSAEAEQVTGKLNKRDDSLLKSDSDECKEQKSKLDLISRQAAVECVGWGDSVTAVISRIKLLPNVQPDQQRGEWIEVEVFPEVYDIDGVKTWGSEMQCDQCGFRHTAIEGHMAQYNFCPSCGADMRGEEE